MSASPLAAARELWANAPLWRGTVMAAVFLTIGATIYSSLAPSRSPAVSDGGAPTRARGTLAPDPDSDARLVSYQAGYTEALKITDAAQRCERLADLTAALQDRDKARAVNPAAPRPLNTAVVDGIRCTNDIAASDRRWQTLDKAVGDAERTPTGSTLAQAVAAGRAITDFDRARSRADTQTALLARLAKLTSNIDASDKRIGNATDAAAALGKENTPANLIRAADAWQQLTEFDRGRLSPAQQTTLAPERDAATTAASSRGRLARLTQATAAVQQPSASPQSRRQFIDALAAITDTDRSIATSEQKSAIEQAEKYAGSIGWSMLQDAAGDFKDGAPPEVYQRLAAAMAVLRNRLPPASTPEQRNALQAAERASAALTTSDAHLAALMRVDEQWRTDRSNTSSGQSVTEVIADITDFDRKRFDEAHRAAWDRLSVAQAIIQGPTLKPPLPKARLPIFVNGAGNAAADSHLISDINAALKQAGFVLAPNANDAAIAIDVSIQKLTDPVADYSGTIVGFRADAIIAAHGVWTIDTSVFLDAQPSGTARNTDSDKTFLQITALRNAIGNFVQTLQNRMDKGG